MKKYLVLIVLLVGILFPFASLMTVSDSYAAAFEMLFGTLASHMIMHAVLYAVLTLILLFPRPSTKESHSVDPVIGAGRCGTAGGHSGCQRKLLAGKRHNIRPCRR